LRIPGSLSLSLSLSLLHWRREQEERSGGVGPWSGPTTRATISGRRVTFIARAVLEESNYLFIFSALSRTFRRSSAIAEAVGNTNVSGAAAHVDTYYVVTPSYRHILTRCRGHHESLQRIARVGVSYNMRSSLNVSALRSNAERPGPTLSVLRSKDEPSSLKLSALRLKAERPQV